MADETYLDLESENPYFQLRVGQITQVITDVQNTQDTKSQQTLGKVKVRWLDWESTEFPVEIPFTYPCFSNPIIGEDRREAGADVGSNRTGSSYGILFMPSVGDIVVCGFREGARPIILGFLPQNFYVQTNTDSSKSSEWGDFKLLKSGEFDLKSKQQAEVFLTEKGTIRLIVKEQPSADTEVPSTALAEIIIGKSYVDEDYTDTHKSKQAKDVVCHIKMESGAGIKIDSDGNIEIDPASGKNVNINDGTKGAARKGDTVKINLISGAISPSTVLGAPIPAVPTSITGTITSGSDNVKIG